MAKTKYNKHLCKLAYEYAKQGLMDYEIFDNLKISHSAFYDYLNKYPDFYDSIKKGRQLAIQKVEGSLFKKAMGYTVTEKSTEVKVEADGTMKPVSVRNTEKHFQADMGAIAFFLKNKDPENWRDRQEIDHTTKGESFKYDLSKYSETELKTLIALLGKSEKSDITG
jgi:hypothetical protein